MTKKILILVLLVISIIAFNGCRKKELIGFERVTNQVPGTDYYYDLEVLLWAESNNITFGLHNFESNEDDIKLKIKHVKIDNIKGLELEEYESSINKVIDPMNDVDHVALNATIYERENLEWYEDKEEYQLDVEIEIEILEGNSILKEYTIKETLVGEVFEYSALKQIMAK